MIAVGHKHELPTALLVQLTDVAQMWTYCHVT
jgi:hypothetical protein